MKKNILTMLILLTFPLVISACGKKSTNVNFQDDSGQDAAISPYTDKLSDAKIVLDQTYNLNQEFKVTYQTFNPNGAGTATFKARSIKAVDSVNDRAPEENKKLVLVEISVKGDRGNSGQPSSFNQIGETPSPQFVLIDKGQNKSYTEETYYSDAYTQSKNLFELTKITLDSDQWIHTAIVFQIDKTLTPDLALRFTDAQGQTKFYDLNESSK
ncbi:MAG: hypothetical protein WC686_02470 [Candidatus Shapirobacteria bacterium]|jgi:hypothetical protein